MDAAVIILDSDDEDSKPQVNFDAISAVRKIFNFFVYFLLLADRESS
jgi:hypothetical protein